MQKQIGRYEIQSELGRGGMATVYHAYDPKFRRDVALKVLPREFLHNAEFRARFEREAMAIASLEHRAIVPVYDYGEEDGLLYLTMRLMPGGSLAERIERGPLTLAQAAEILDQLAPALDLAHSRGIVHRDLKPQNILFDRDGHPYLTDFGIVKLLESDQAALTATGKMIGTPAYMSPEQVMGEVEPDRRSDVYSLGIVVYEMLTGHAPFEATTPIRMAMKHLEDPVPRLEKMRGDLPAGTQVVLEKALAKKREERYGSAGAFAEALCALAEGKSPIDPAATIAVATVPRSEQVAGSKPSEAEHAEAAVVPAGHQAAADSAPVPPEPEEARGRGRSWLWVIGLAALLVFLLLACGVAAIAGRMIRDQATAADSTATPALTETVESEIAVGVLKAESATTTRTPEPPATATALPTATTAPSPTATPDPSVPPAGAGLGDAWLRPIDGMKMLFVPAGAFTMGSAEFDADAIEREFPLHEVTLAAFWIDETEVTNEQFAAFVADTGYVTSAEELDGGQFLDGSRWVRDAGVTWLSPGGPGSDLAGLERHPVVVVSWLDGDSYCRWAGGRLPTEAEWEYAARGPESRRYPWGDTFDAGLLNYCDSNCTAENADGEVDDGYAQTAPVGSFPGGASWVGALDMAGNVWERISDWYGETYYQDSPAENPPGPGEGDQKGTRGGGWSEDFTLQRSAYRGRSGPEFAASRAGFRCAYPTGTDS